MTVELTHNNHRYMVDGGQWYRRLEVGEVIPNNFEVLSELGIWWPHCHMQESVKLHADDYGAGEYRAACTDPRPPFTVGQRVKVARKDESWNGWFSDLRTIVGLTGSVVEIVEDGRLCLSSVDFWKVWLPPWCLDAVTGQTKEEDR